jgi:hypothetical protein
VDPNNSKYDSRNNCNCIIETETNTLIVGCENSIIPESVTTIGTYAFSRQISSTSYGQWISYVIPDHVKYIEDGAFNGCSKIRSFTIGSNVEYVGYIFLSSNVNELICKPVVAPEFHKYAFRDLNTKSDIENCVLKYPKGSDYSEWLSKLQSGRHNWVGQEV